MSSLRPSSRRGITSAGRIACTGSVFLVLVCAPAWSHPATASCPGDLPAAGLLSDRETSIRSQGQLPDACLKSLVRQCDAEAEAGFLDGGSAAACSLRYEALLRHRFRGDFHSFLRWWQNAPSVASQ